MKIIATLGSSVRLVVFEFLMRTPQVPSIITLKQPSVAPPVPPVSGVQVLESTPKTDLFLLAFNIANESKYELVSVWKKPQEDNWGLCFVRFVFCHKEHVNQDKLFPGFVAKKDELLNILTDMVAGNLWTTQAYLNPYFENGIASDHQVLMIGCASCRVGPKTIPATSPPRLNLVAGKNVTFAAPTPEPVPETVSTPIAKSPSTIIEEF